MKRLADINQWCCLNIAKEKKKRSSLDELLSYLLSPLSSCLALHLLSFKNTWWNKYGQICQCPTNTSHFCARLLTDETSLFGNTLLLSQVLSEMNHLEIPSNKHVCESVAVWVYTCLCISLSCNCERHYGVPELRRRVVSVWKTQAQSCSQLFTCRFMKASGSVMFWTLP